MGTKIQKKRDVKSQAIRHLEEIALQHLQEKYPSVPYPPRKKYSDRTANGLTRCILDYLTFSGYQAERINSTGRRIDKTKVVSDCLGRSRRIGSVKWIKGSGRNGTNISATILGRSVKIEIKCEATGDRYQSAAQKSYQEEVEAAGGIYIIARTFHGFMSWYREFINQNKK